MLWTNWAQTKSRDRRSAGRDFTRVNWLERVPPRGGATEEGGNDDVWWCRTVDVHASVERFCSAKLPHPGAIT
jgi:hypothetical protein